MRYFLIFIVFQFCGGALHAQHTPDYRQEAALLRKALSQHHFQPRELDDQFSKDLYNLFLESLDGDRLLFTEADLKVLEPFRDKLDDEMNGKSWEFLKVVTPLLRRSLDRTIAIIKKQSEVPFSISTTELFTYDTLHWAKDEKELHQRWRNWMHYQVLDRLAYTREVIPGDGKDFFLKNEPAARLKVAGIESRGLQRILTHPGGFDYYVASLFFQSVTMVFDAHSVYMGVTDMENFLAATSTEGYYFGISIDEDDHGTVLITSVTPGSPAWKSGVIEIGDELLSVKMEGQTGDATGLSMEEVNQILSDANHSLVEFRLRTPVGLEKTVKLKKEKISMEENFVRSFLLIGAQGQRYGYIYLPQFYTRWDEDSEGSRCANDVAMEVIKLSKEKIEGIILDVRDNGGGSLAEAAALAGIFIDEGPLAITRNRANDLNLYKDASRGTIFTGPMILMVNSQSASASEFLAAALQDYHRAVVVGTRTFGKATAQRLFPLDPSQPEPSLSTVKTGAGFATITVEKIYRITGKTAQHIGVVPDVTLPHIHFDEMIRESRIPFALRADSVQRKTYYKPLSDLPLMALRQHSVERVKVSPQFNLIRSTDEWLSRNVGPEEAPVSLNWSTCLAKAREDMTRLKAFETVISDTSKAFDVRNESRDQFRMELDEFAKTYNDQWIKKLKSDIYLEEVFHIMNDLVELTSQSKK